MVHVVRFETINFEWGPVISFNSFEIPAARHFFDQSDGRPQHRMHGPRSAQSEGTNEPLVAKV